MELPGISRRSVLRGAVALGVAVSLVACAGPAGGGGGSDGSTELTIALPVAVTGLDPAGVQNKQDLIVRSQINPGLTVIAPDLSVQPQLAERWENPDPLTWVFHLRAGAVFENGTPLDAQMVADNFARIMTSPDAASTGNSDLVAGLSTVEVVDPQTVVLHLKSPWVELPRRLDRTYFTDVGWAAGANLTTSAMSSGPYRVASYDPQTQIVLEANPTYYGPAPAYSRVTYRFITTPAARLAAIQSGEVDLVTALDPQDMPQVEGDSRLQSGGVQSSRVMFVGFNTARAPFDRLEVREAFNLAVNKQAIVDSIYRGLTQPQQGQILTQAYSGFNPDVPAFGYDPDRARALLAQAGYPDGFPMTMTVPQGAYVGIDLAAQAIASQLAEVGIQVSIQSVPQATWAQTWSAADPPEAQLTAFQTPENRSMLLGWSDLYSRNHAVDPEFDAIYARVVGAGNQADLDGATREAMVRQHDFAQSGFLWPLPLTYAASTGVSVTMRPDEYLRATDMRPAT